MTWHFRTHPIDPLRPSWPALRFPRNIHWSPSLCQALSQALEMELETYLNNELRRQ